MVSALSVLHRHQIVHNDIKPGNILLDFEGHWNLCDFGSCSRLNEPRSQPVRFTARYCPIDFNSKGKIKKCSVAFDYMLLTVTVLDRMGLMNLDGGFSIRQLKEATNDVVEEDLHSLLKELIITL